MESIKTALPKLPGVHTISVNEKNIRNTPQSFFLTVKYDPRICRADSVLENITDHLTTWTISVITPPTVSERLETVNKMAKAALLWFTVPTLAIIAIGLASPEQLEAVFGADLLPGLSTAATLSFALVFPIYLTANVIHSKESRVTKSSSVATKFFLWLSTTSCYCYASCTVVLPIIQAIFGRNSYTDIPVPEDAILYFQSSAVLIMIGLLCMYARNTLKCGKSGSIIGKPTLLHRVLHPNGNHEQLTVNRNQSDVCNSTLSNTQSGQLDSTQSVIENFGNNSADQPPVTDKGKWRDPSLLNVGDTIVILGGQTIPADCVSLNSSPVYVNESAITGKETPSLKYTGDTILRQSTLVEGNTLQARVTAIGNQTVYGRLTAIINSCLRTETTVERNANKFSDIMVTILIYTSLLTMAIWAFIIYVYPDYIEENLPYNSSKILFVFTFGLGVISIACPHSNALGTSTTINASLASLKREGVITKKNAAISQAAEGITDVVFSMCGTLTTGDLEIQKMSLISSSNPRDLMDFPDKSRYRIDHKAIWPSNNLDFAATEIDQVPKHSSDDLERCKFLAWLMACVETESNHAIARAIVKFWRSRGPSGNEPYTLPLATATFTKSFAGEGIVGEVDTTSWKNRFPSVAIPGISEGVSHYHVAIGNSRLMKRYECESHINFEVRAEAAGEKISTYLAVNRSIVAEILFDDTIKPEAKSVVSDLQKKHNVTVWLCTGGSLAASSAVAERLGISQSNNRFSMSPEEKLAFANAVSSSKINNTQRKVLLIGDGTNDREAMKAAFVSVAMGIKPQTISAPADFLILGSDLRPVSLILDRVKMTRTLLKLNNFLCFIFNSIAIPLAAGMAYPTVTISPMMNSLLIFLFNSLWLLSSIAVIGSRGLKSRKQIDESESQLDDRELHLCAAKKLNVARSVESI